MKLLKSRFFVASIGLLVLLVSFLLISFSFGFQSSNYARGLASLAQLCVLFTGLIWAMKVQKLNESSKLLKFGLLLAFAIALFKVVFFLLISFANLIPIFDMAYEGHARSMVSKLESITDLNSANQLVKSELSPTFLLIFVFLGAFITGAAASFVFYLIKKTQNQWSYR